MKLVQLLAKELKEWPDNVKCITQDGDGHLYGWRIDGAEFRDHAWYSPYAKDLEMMDIDIECWERSSDNKTSKINKLQWQDEREKMNKPKWIRHRGGWMPVGAATIVEVRLRCGDVQKHEACEFLWRHKDCDSAANIMAYRVIEETKDQEIEEVIPKHMAFGYASKEEMVAQIGEECPFAQVASTAEKTNFGTITYKLEIDATDANKEIDSFVAKWGQIESPLKWRDAIIHCQAIIEDCEREIQRNVNLLDAEGLMMQKDSKKAMQHYQTDIDMSDWRNWQIGDRVCAIKNFDDAGIGDELIITRLDHADEEQPIGVSTGSSATYWPEINWVKFVRRP